MTVFFPFLFLIDRWHITCLFVYYMETDASLIIGGLGDVAGSLPKALARRGHRVMVLFFSAFYVKLNIIAL